MASEDKKCTATVIVEYDKKSGNIGPVTIENKDQFLTCVKGEAKSATASAVKQTVSRERKVGDGETISEAYGQKSDANGGKRRRKSRRRGKRGGRKSKRRTGKKARKSKKSKRRSGKKSKSKRRRK